MGTLVYCIDNIELILVFIDIFFKWISLKSANIEHPTARQFMWFSFLNLSKCLDCLLFLCVAIAEFIKKKFISSIQILKLILDWRKLIDNDYVLS